MTSVAHAESLDVAKTLEKVTSCGGDPFDKLGTIEKAESIGKRPTASVFHLIGKKARADVEVIAVAGKPLAFAKGNFGNARRL